MKIVWIVLGSLLLVAVGFVGAIFAASEMAGEIVVLETRDAAGEPVETRLWVVDHEGHAWLRAGQPTSGWFVRLETEPEVRVERDGVRAAYRAVPVDDPAIRDRIHALNRDKYGGYDAFISLARDGSLSIPVRLDPLSESG